MPSCPICGKRFSTASLLSRHIHYEHAAHRDGRYCPICGVPITRRLIDHCREMAQKYGDARHATLWYFLASRVHRSKAKRREQLKPLVELAIDFLRS